MNRKALLIKFFTLPIMEHDQDPIELKSGELGCPRCSTQLVNEKVPYFVNGIKMGEFDGLLCEICRYGLLSEKGYEDSGKKVKEMALVGQFVYHSTEKYNLYNEPIENSEIIDNKIDISQLPISKNKTEEYHIGEIKLKGENLTKYSIEQPILTIHSKNKLRL